MKGIKFEKVSFGSFLKNSLSCGLNEIINWETKYSSFSDYLKDIYDNIELPVRKTKGSAGYDFNCPFELKVAKDKKVKFPTGIKVKMPSDVVLEMHIRSSLGSKYDLYITNITGIIDSDYYENPSTEGDIMISISNNSNNDFILPYNCAVTQGIFVKYETTEDDNADGERVGGFGSTSK